MIRTPSIACERVHAALPIFRLDCGDCAVFYAPGERWEVPRGEVGSIEHALSGRPAASAGRVIAQALEHRARGAVKAWQELAERPFEPECLTLYLSNRCNLGCGYCYARPADDALAGKRLRWHTRRDLDEKFPVLAERVVYAAAAVVARHCARKAMRFTLVFHGGGAPTLHWALLQAIRSHTEDIARHHGVALWTYLATHGVLPEDRAQWLAGNFNLIGLSCDGPPDIQDAQRRLASGGATSVSVERTARIFHELGAAFTVRATITPATVQRQPELLEYFCDHLHAQAVRFEPAYGANGQAPRFSPEDADAFVEGFLAARDVAKAKRCDLRLSGVRPDEIHGPYCNPLRDVLQLVPDGEATACFLTTGEHRPEDGVMAMGGLDPASGEFVVDQRRAMLLRRQAARIPARCEQCFNIYHCARDCPDVCVISATDVDHAQAGFRCRVQRRLGFHWLTTGEDAPGLVSGVSPPTPAPTEGGPDEGRLRPRRTEQDANIPESRHRDHRAGTRA